jgi:hypothetical protein
MATMQRWLLAKPAKTNPRAARKITFSCFQRPGPAQGAPGQALTICKLIPPYGSEKLQAIAKAADDYGRSAMEKRRYR